MAVLPELPNPLPDATQAIADHLVAVRSHAEGSAELAGVYAALLHNPALADRVAALGEQIRFTGALPDDVREVVILRYAARHDYDYEWMHHQRPAALAGLQDSQVAALRLPAVPVDLRDDQQAAVQATDAICDGVAIPLDVQDILVAAYGEAGIVELVVTCGLYAIMGYTVRSFDVPLELWLRNAPA